MADIDINEMLTEEGLNKCVTAVRENFDAPEAEVKFKTISLNTIILEDAEGNRRILTATGDVFMPAD